MTHQHIHIIQNNPGINIVMQQISVSVELGWTLGLPLCHTNSTKTGSKAEARKSKKHEVRSACL